MADPTVFSLPRRRMAIADYSLVDTTLLTRRDVGIINGAEGGMARETDEYLATDLSTGVCTEYVADSKTNAGQGSLTIEMMSSVAANLGLMLSSDVTTVASAAATQETTATLVDDDVIQTNFMPDPSTVVIADSAGTPATLVLGTDYEFVAQKAGLIRILGVTGFTQPFTIDYTKIDQKTIDPMSNLDAFFDIVFAGGNERNSCGGEFERFYRCRISDEQTRRLHEAAETKTPVSMSVTFTIDRDPARSYRFGTFGVTEA